MTSFYEKLAQSEKKQNSLLCVGLDNPDFEFNKKIIDQTHDLVCAYKPNTAFYEAEGSVGIKNLKEVCTYIKTNYPKIVLIVDAKRADIGNTNNGYVTFVFDYLGADAITLQPYLGREALQPFLDRKDKGNIILCRTSNPGAGEFQDLLVGGKPVYQRIAEQVVAKWNTNENCALVVGATYPEEMKIVRQIAPNMPFLIPGVGAQGGEVEATVKMGVDSNGGGAIINSARGIIFANDPRTEALKLRDEINKYRGGKS